MYDSQYCNVISTFDSIKNDVITLSDASKTRFYFVSLGTAPRLIDYIEATPSESLVMPVGSIYVVAGNVLVNFNEVAIGLWREVNTSHSLLPFFDDFSLCRINVLVQLFQRNRSSLSQ